MPFFQTPAFGIIAMVLVGSSWCLIGLISGDAPKRKIEPALFQFFGFIVAGGVALLLMLATKSFPQCSFRAWMLAGVPLFISAILNFSMLLLMAYAMQRGPNGIIWCVIQSALVFPFLGGIVFFGVELTWLRALGILALLTALVLFACSKDNSRYGQGWRLPAFAALILAALQQNLSVMPSYFEEARVVTSTARTMISAVGGLAGAICYLSFRMIREHSENYAGHLLHNLKNPALWFYVLILQGFGLVFAITLFYPGMNAMADAGLGGMCYPMMVGSCIVSFTLTSVWFLKEKVRLPQLAALVICITGLVLICTR